MASADAFNAVAERRRRDIIEYLAGEERAVCDIVVALGIEQPSVSKHLRVLREVDAPIVGRAVLVAAVFAFTVSMGEFGATLLINLPDWPTMPVLIYTFLGQPGAANYGQALAMSTLLMLVTAACFVAIERLRIGDIGEF